MDEYIISPEGKIVEFNPPDKPNTKATEDITPPAKSRLQLIVNRGRTLKTYEY